jgi:protoporphyrin/coproporphyrin ferrochelatase
MTFCQHTQTESLNTITDAPSSDEQIKPFINLSCYIISKFNDLLHFYKSETPEAFLANTIDMTQKATPSVAIIIINVGTPNSPKVSDVRTYLSEFLGDGRVIDLPWLGRKLLVNGIIVPFRAPKSAKLYQQLWTDRGSPLLFHTHDFADSLQKQLANRASVYVAMRYGKPSIKQTISDVLSRGYKRIVVAPMFPHYASSTTGTAIEETMRVLKTGNVVPETAFLGQFYNEPAYIDSFVSKVREEDPASYDHVLFSYHGLPQRHVQRTHAQTTKCNMTCCRDEMPAFGEFCYHATCYETTRLIARKLELTPNSYSTAFQSRLGKGWIEPFSDEEVIRLAQKGIKKLLIVSPAFVADCLETTIELGIEYRELFEANGGHRLKLVESLNAMPQWVSGFVSILESRFGI